MAIVALGRRVHTVGGMILALNNNVVDSRRAFAAAMGAKPSCGATSKRLARIGAS
jgi:hypothetical protein